MIPWDDRHSGCFFLIFNPLLGDGGVSCHHYLPHTGPVSTFMPGANQQAVNFLHRIRCITLFRPSLLVAFLELSFGIAFFRNLPRRRTYLVATPVHGTLARGARNLRRAQLTPRSSMLATVALHAAAEAAERRWIFK